MTRNQSPRNVTTSGVTLGRDVWRGVGIVGFLVAGILFGVASGISFVVERPIDYLDVHLTVAIAFLLLGVWGLYALQKQSLGRTGRWGFFTFVAGLLLLGVGTAATYAGVPVVPFVPVALVGLPLAWLGGLLFGAATYRAAELPAWSGVLLAAGFPAATATGFVLQLQFGTPSAPSGAFSGAVVAGVCWLGVVYALWTSVPERYRT